MDVSLQLSESGNSEKQVKFLRRHDDHSRRLTFIWDDNSYHKPVRCACFGGCEFFGRNFTPATWKGLGKFIDLSNFNNDPGLEIGQRIFESSENSIQIDIISLESLLSNFATKEPKNSRLGSQIVHNVSPRNVVNERQPFDSSGKKPKDAWIPDRRRPSIGSVDSFYSAADIEVDRDGDRNNEVPDFMKDMDRISVAALSQTTISTISMAPDRTQPTSNVSSFPVNLHAQLSKKTQESPLLMAGYVPQVPLWQRGIINVTIIGNEKGYPQESQPRFSFYLPNFQKVKGGLDVSEAFKPKSTSFAKNAKLHIPRHYRSQSSQLSSGSRFVDFGKSNEFSKYQMGR